MTLELIEVEAMTGSLEQATEAELLRALLAARDVPCPVCAYNLRRITSANCPECGAQLDLRVASTDLKHGPWLVALFGLALPAGFVGVHTLLGLVFLNMEGLDPNMGFTRAPIVLAPFATCGAYALFLWRLIRNRRKFWSRPRRAQRHSAILYALLGPGLLVIGFVLIRVISGVVF